MPGYADVEDPATLLAQDAGLSGGSSIEDAISEAGFQVQAVNWVWEQVVGEDLVSSIITPITGDFEKIAKGAAQWNNVRDALQAVRNNLNGGLEELSPHWTGEASEAFAKKIGMTWTLGIEADAQAAKLIGMALSKVADGSRAACDQILNLIEWLVNKLIEAAAMLPIPVVGWGRAVKLVYDGIQLYNKIMDLIDGVQQIIEGAQQVIDGVQQVGTALSKIDDINSLNDFLNVANEAGQGAAAIKEGASSVKDGATQASDAAGGIRDTAASAADNARGLADERSAARDSGTSTSSDGSTDASGTGTPGDGRAPSTRDDSMAANAGDPNTEGRPKECVPGSGDPVDLATGQMFMSQTDLSLPGVLPLVLERTHFSDYRVGRYFGRSWASTLDQRLEIGANTVYLSAPDGQRLRYPLPADGQTVYPETGSRWGLSRADDTYVVMQPQLGRTLQFLPGASRRQLGAIIDRNGNRIEFRYGPEGVPSEILHSGGYRLGVDSADGLITRLWLHNPLGTPITVQSYGYDDDGRLTEVVNSSGRPMRFEYDSDGRITQWTDRNGEWYRYHYNPQGRVTASEGSGSALTGSWEYDDAARIRRYTDSLGHTATFAFNERWQLVAETNPLGQTRKQEWNAFNQLLSSTDALGRTTRSEYDGNGNLVTITRPDDTSVRAIYNDLDCPTMIIDPDGATWRREYDAAGNLIAVTDPVGSVTRFGYDANGGLTSVTDPLGSTRRVETNSAGLPVAATDGLGAQTAYLRDVFGRVHTVVDPAGGRLRMTWTIEGKPLSRVLPDGSTERWRYDGEGNLVEYVDALGHRTRTEYGHFDLPKAQTAADGTRLEFSYDQALRLVSVTNQQGLRWRYEYDPAGNLVSETDFNGRTLRYRHDAAGQLAARVNGAGETVTFSRDALGRVVEKRAGDAASTFELDPAGRLLRASSPEVEVRLERDPLGRVLAESVNGRTVRSAYDALGRRVSRRTPSGAESTWTYDANDQPVSLTSGGHTLRFDYDVAGREVRRQLGAGAVLAQSWDANHRLTSQRVTAPDLYSPDRPGRVVQQRAFYYRPDGNLSGIDDIFSGSRRFELDAAGRVTAVQGNGWTERYAYDATGNVTQAQSPAAAPEAQGPREYAGTLIKRAGNTAFQYDAQGRLVLRRRRTLSGQQRSWTFAWNAEDRLVGVTTPDGSRWRYTYDAMGRRVGKERLDAAGAVDEQITFTWDGFTLAEQTSTGPTPDGLPLTPRYTTVWDFQPGTFRPVTQSERVPDEGSQEWVDQQFYALVTDLIGTPTEMVDPDGDLAWRSSTTVWGEALGQLTTGPSCPLRFPGQYHDPETGDNYNYFRYYNPGTGSYTSNDPVGLAGGLNPSRYVPNPTIWVDALGLAPSCQSTPKALPAATREPPNAGPILSREAQPGEEFNMVLSQGQPNTSPGGFGTFDNIPNQAYARDQLAIRSDWKPDVSQVQRYRIPDDGGPPIRIQESTVGPQVDPGSGRVLPGGGTQLEIINYGDRARLVPVGSPTAIS